MERNLAAWRIRTEPLNATEWALLVAWPTHILNYALQPEATAPAHALIDHLSSSHWPRPVEWTETVSILPAESAAGTRSHHRSNATTDVATGTPSPDSSPTPLPIMPTKMIERLQSAVAVLARIAQARELSGLVEVTDRVHGGLALVPAANDFQPETVRSLCTPLAIAARGYFAMPGNERASHALINVLAAPTWPQPLTDAERDQLLVQLRAPHLARSTVEEDYPMTTDQRSSEEDRPDEADEPDPTATLDAMFDHFQDEPEVASFADPVVVVGPSAPMTDSSLPAASESFDRAGAEETLACIEGLAIERGALGIEEACVRARQGLHALCDEEPPRSAEAAIASIETAAIEQGLLGLEEACLRARHGLYALGEEPLATTLIEDFSAIARAYLYAPDAPATRDALVALLAEPRWPQPLSDDDAPLLSSLLQASGTAEESVTGEVGERSEQAREAARPTPSMATAFEHSDDPLAHLEPDEDHAPTAVQSDSEADPAGVSVEMIGMLRAESAKLEPVLAQLLQRAAGEAEASVRGTAAESYGVEIGRLAAASTAIGLATLGELLGHVHHFLSRDGTRGMSAGQRDALSDLPALLGTYLAQPNDPGTAEALVGVVHGFVWSSPVDAEECIRLALGLSEVVLVSNAGDQPARQTTAAADDVSLALPDDMNQELFESLLQELPVQTAAFSDSIHRLAGTTGTDTDVDLARRAAHTLKGAANTVGIRGIATLTHHVEDILTALFKDRAKPDPALAAVLVDASDCLEAMCEFVTGVGPEPDRPIAVLQAVLDSANGIDRDGIEGASTAPATVARDITEATADHANTPNVGDVDAVARVPVTLIDELLRLTGETIISTGQVSDRLRKVIDHVHTIHRQNQTFVTLAAEMENLVDVRGLSSNHQRRAASTEFDALEFDYYGEIHTVSRRLSEAATDSRAFTAQIETDLTALNELVADQSRLHLQSQEAVMQTRMVPASTILSRLQRSLRQTSRQLDKDIKLNVSGAETPIDSQILAALVDPLMHMLRNATDHGIETAAVRSRAGKSTAGKIDLAFAREGNHILVRMQDDGAGLDLAAVRRTAEEKGLVRPDATLSDDELRRMILAPGFSTRSEATQLSGRGVGMDIVHSAVLQLKGSINLRSKPGQGLLVELRLPAALISTHALQIGVEGRVLTVSTRGIDDIVYASASQLQSIGGVLSIRLADEYLALVDLESLLELPIASASRERSAFPTLLVRQESGARKAIRVREVISSRDIVVKPLSVYLPKIQGIVGLTVLGDGDVQPVIDLLDLLRASTQGGPRRDQDTLRTESSPSAVSASHTVLVIDDSISARRATAQCMKDAGFVPRTAIDGQDALAILDKWTPDIVLVDMEMPRMNGLEFAVALRARPSTQHTPMIMITSRSTEKHRRQAEAAGVDVYLTKPFSEDELVRRARELITARADAPIDANAHA